MEKIFLPSKVEIIKGDKPDEAVFSIQPCQPGYGITIGNALRRVLLSSLPGGAITSFKIKGADHEFTTLPHVSEDVVDITLNLKQIRVKTHSDEPVKLTISAKGAKTVTAADIKENADVEIINKDQVICTLTEKDAAFEGEITVSKGRGYVPVEVIDKEALSIGEIAIDSIFTPVRNVAFTVEMVRVGDQTNFENVLLKVETDGTMEPKEAMEQALQIILDHFNFIQEKVKTGNIIPQLTDERPTASMTISDEVVIGDESEEKTKEDESDSAKAMSDEEEPKPKKRGRPKKTEAVEE